jgi:hypothetical protein
MKFLMVLLLLASTQIQAKPREVNEYHWEGVDRIVAIGDLHGDFDNYMATLRAAGLVDKKGKWIAGETHLVQTGDIPDRGPDTLDIIEHISKLAKQAKRKGGRVHSLMGNHEAMNVYGDLRYVHPGEYEAFVNRNSAALRDRYYQAWMDNLAQVNPEAIEQLPVDHRQQWNVDFPLGWVEHRQAWDPAWNPEGEYANWVLERKVAMRVNDTIFLHGGISGYYCQNDFETITEMAHATLSQFDPRNPGIVEDDNGPLWYRGLSGITPEAPVETVDAILQHHGASHIVVGHTPTSGVIWPRYDAKVVMIDTGIARAYGGFVAYLEITPEGLFAGYPKGKLPIPSDEGGLVPYLEKVIEMDPENAYLTERLERLLHPPAPVEAVEGDASATGENADAPPADASTAETAPEEPPPPPPPICGIFQ